MKFPVLWSGLCCYTEGWGGKCSEILATIKLLYNPRVNKVFRHFTSLLDLFVNPLITVANRRVRLCSQEANKASKIYVGRSTTVSNLLFCADTLFKNYFLSQQDTTICFEHGRKSELKL